MIKINCKNFEDLMYCKDKRTKRTLLGFGGRVCIEVFGKDCGLIDPIPRPLPPPGPFRREDESGTKKDN